ELLELAGQFGRACHAVFQDDAGRRLQQLIAVFPANDGGFLDRRMFDQHALNLYWTDPYAAALQHVVGASGIPEEAVGILVILVAGADPVAFDGVLGALVLVPVEGTGAVGFHQKIADIALLHGLIIFIDDASFVAGDDLAA